MKRLFKVLIGCVIGSMAFVSCGKDEPVDIDNLDYFVAYGASIDAYYADYEVTETQKQIFDIVFAAFESKLTSIPGYVAVDKYKFRINQTTLYPAIEIIKQACYDAEAQLKMISEALGKDIEEELDIQLTVSVAYQACDKSVDIIYSKTFGYIAPPVDGV